MLFARYFIVHSNKDTHCLERQNKPEVSRCGFAFRDMLHCGSQMVKGGLVVEAVACASTFSLNSFKLSFRQGFELRHEGPNRSPLVVLAWMDVLSKVADEVRAEASA